MREEINEIFFNMIPTGIASNLRRVRRMPLALPVSFLFHEDYAWEICQQLWDQIPEACSQHGLKHLGGAGRVVWLDNGKVVDYDWCALLTNWESRDDIDKIKRRTQTNFK